MKIAGVEIGPRHPCRFVAEISNNHNGRLELAQRLIVESACAGADFVKFQAYTPDELVELRGDGPAPDPWGTDGWTMRDLYAKAQTPADWFPDLVEYCHYVGVPWFASVFGQGSLDLMEDLGCPAYKVAALDEGATALIDVVRATGKPIIASTHKTGGPRVAWADLLLHCPPGYPQDPCDIDYQAIRRGGYDGLSYHGTNPNVPVSAANGAQVVEFHVQADDEPSELEADVSLTISKLRYITELVGRYVA